MDDLTTLLLLTLATARVTRLLTHDRLTHAPRERLLEKLRPGGLPSYLVTCTWCTSVYVGAAGAGAWWAWGGDRWFTAACAALTASYVTGFITSREVD